MGICNIGVFSKSVYAFDHRRSQALEGLDVSRAVPRIRLARRATDRLIALEEADLLASRGDSFREYCAAVPRFWPAIPPRIPAGNAQPQWLQAFVGEVASLVLAAAVGAYAITLDQRYTYWICFPILVAYTIIQILWKQSARRQSRS